MFGLIAKVTTTFGKRKEMIEFLTEIAANMPGCLSFVVAEDCSDENAIWVSEAWESVASYEASLTSPNAERAMVNARAIFASFEKIAVTNPICVTAQASAIIFPKYSTI
jgi:quinol monooxygenase YgiN